MLSRFRIFLILSCICTPLLADDPGLGPVLRSYGPTFAVDNPDVPLREGFAYKVVFDMGEATGQSTTLNRELVSVARFLNMHARHGVRPEGIDVAVVLHGEALKSALNRSAYQSRYSTANANHELLLELHAAGVRFYACGQSMGFRGFQKEELLEPVKVALSAMTMLTYLQADGYALLP